jgi:adenylate kinase
MRVLLIAPPGAGKGTQGAIIASHFDIPHIGTGDLLRDHVVRGTPLGRSVRGYLDRGELVPDEVILEMVRDAFIEARVKGMTGFVLDGMPRTMDQAQAAYRIGKELDMTADVVIHLKVSDTDVTRRLRTRARVEGRSDDTPELVAKRLAVYHAVTHPVIGWYAERGIVVPVDSSRPIPQVATDILVALRIRESRLAVLNGP